MTATANVVLVEEDGSVRTRLGRALSSALDGDEIVHLGGFDPQVVAEAQPTLLACNGSHAGLALELIESRLPFCQLLVWSARDSRFLVSAGLEQPRFNNIIGWPGFQTTPRPWEVAMASRRLCDPRVGIPRLSDLLRWGAALHEWTPHTSEDLGEVVSQVRTVALRTTGNERTAERAAIVMHELLMNAMYGAPTDSGGDKLFARSRKEGLSLDHSASPSARLGMDGTLLALQVEDPFGSLSRTEVFRSIGRGLRNSAGNRSADSAVDTSGGGAGLGLFTAFNSSAVTIFDLAPGRCTEVTVLMDLDLQARDRRTMPKSIHVFER